MALTGRMALIVFVLAATGCASSGTPTATTSGSNSALGPSTSVTPSVTAALDDAERVWCDQNPAQVASAGASLDLLSAPFDDRHDEAIGVWAEAYGPELPNLEDPDAPRVLVTMDELEVLVVQWSDRDREAYARSCAAAFAARN